MRPRTLVGILLGLGCAALLIQLLFQSADVGQLATMLGAAQLPWVFALVAATAASVGLAAEKWRLVEGAICGDLPSRGRAFAYSAVGTAAGQILPSQIANAAARSLGNRWHIGTGARRGALTSVWEQAFDLLIMALLIVPAGVAVALSSATIFLMLAPVALLTGVALLKAGLAWSGWLRANTLMPRMGRLVAAAQDAGLMGPDLTFQLYTLSICRALILWLMAAIVSAAVNSPVPADALAVCLPFAVLASVFSMLPAGIGANEWTFSAILATLGVPFGAAAAWALVNRLLVAQASLLIGVVGIALLGWERRNVAAT